MNKNEDFGLNLSQKFRANLGGILLYGLTPPKLDLAEQNVREVAQKQLARLDESEIDGLVIYDLQDESGRSGVARTFEFKGTITPEVYWREYLGAAHEAVIYKAIGKYESGELAEFLRESGENDASDAPNFGTKFGGNCDNLERNLSDFGRNLASNLEQNLSEKAADSSLAHSAKQNGREILKISNNNGEFDANLGTNSHENLDEISSAKFNSKFGEISKANLANLSEISSTEIANFTAKTAKNRVANCVFVGMSCKQETPKITLNDAYKLKSKIAPRLNLGGICIPERHAKKGDEDLRVAQKTALGCEFFITQAVYNLENAKRFLDDYSNLSIKKVPIIFTFTPCGSEKTLEFMRWLGIAVPKYFEKRLFCADDPLGESVRLGREMFEFLYKYGRAKGISVGANVESISTRKVEIDASIALLGDIRKIIKQSRF